jgi:hypothetical protein
MSDNIPSVIFAYNRPDKLKRVLEALKTQPVERLKVFVDGPRDNNDYKHIEECRALAKAIDWADTELIFKDKNTGFAGILKNISSVMASAKSAIFIEDDCLPMPGFIWFMGQSLRQYEAQKKVFSIGGYQYIAQEFFKNYRYSLVSSARFVCLGWATWQDRWQLMEPYIAQYFKLFNNLANIPAVADIPQAARACAKGRDDSWDIKVAVCMLWLEKVQLLPVKGLVYNIGLDSGIHTKSGNSRFNRNICTEHFEKIVWLDNLNIDQQYSKQLKRIVKITRAPIKIENPVQFIKAIVWLIMPELVKDWWIRVRQPNIS